MAEAYKPKFMEGHIINADSSSFLTSITSGHVPATSTNASAVPR